jgi:hypothetical protein
MVASTKPDVIGQYKSWILSALLELLIQCLPKIYELSINPKNVKIVDVKI